MTFEYRPPAGLITGSLSCLWHKPSARHLSVPNNTSGPDSSSNAIPHIQLHLLVNLRGASNSAFPEMKLMLFPSQCASCCTCHWTAPQTAPRESRPRLLSECALSCCILWVFIKSLRSCHSPLPSLCQDCHHASPGLHQGPPNWSLHTFSPLLNTLSTCKRGLFKTQDFILWLHH